MDVTHRQRRFFLAVARVKSFTSASILNVTQPALTVQIRLLEETLGVKLFDSDTRFVELTRMARDPVKRDRVSPRRPQQTPLQNGSHFRDREFGRHMA